MQPTPEFSARTVLVVEDNMVNQLLVVNLLKRFGFGQVDTAANGRDALQKMEQRSYDVVLMDIQMPGMDGYEVTKQMRGSSKDSTRKVPVIALSGDASDKEKAKAAEAGMNDYVAKPYSPQELRDVIARHLDVGSETSDGGAIDMSRLEQFTGGDKAFTIQLMEVFLEQVPQSVDAIEKMLPEKQWQEIFPVAHKIKSSFAVFGLEDLRSCIEKIEMNSRDEIKQDEIPLLFLKYKTGCEAAVSALNAELQQLRK